LDDAKGEGREKRPAVLTASTGNGKSVSKRKKRSRARFTEGALR